MHSVAFLVALQAFNVVKPQRRKDVSREACGAPLPLLPSLRGQGRDRGPRAWHHRQADWSPASRRIIPPRAALHPVYAVPTVLERRSLPPRLPEVFADEAYSVRKDPGGESRNGGPRGRQLEAPPRRAGLGTTGSGGLALTTLRRAVAAEPRATPEGHTPPRGQCLSRSTARSRAGPGSVTITRPFLR